MFRRFFFFSDESLTPEKRAGVKDRVETFVEKTRFLGLPLTHKAALSRCNVTGEKEKVSRKTVSEKTPTAVSREFVDSKLAEKCCSYHWAIYL
jgi:uncharacterized protein with PIN domain